MFDWFNNSFLRKVSVFLVTGGFLITFTYASLNYMQEKQSYSGFLDYQTKQLTRTLALLVEEDVRYEKYYEIWNKLREVHKNNQLVNSHDNLFSIREIYVTGLDGKILGHTDAKNHPLKSTYIHPAVGNNPFPDSATPEIQSMPFSESRTLIQRAPLTFGGDRIGYLYVDFDTSPAADLTGNLMKDYISYQALATLIILLVSIPLARLITSPLLYTIHKLSDIGSGQLILPELTRRKDEYRILGVALEQADRRITEDHQRLIDQHRIIEDNAARLLAILNTTIDVIININAEGIIQNTNKVITDVFGYDKDEVIGSNVTLLMPEQYHRQHTSKLLALSHPENSPIIGKTIELEGLRKNGEVFPIELSVGYWHTGNEIQFTGVIRDITQRKLTESELARHQEQLEELVFERTAALEYANKELESFSYSVSHDLRSPLRSIDGFSLALLEDYSEKFDETGQDYLRRVRDNTQRMGELIDDILKLSRISRFEIQREEINLSRLTENIKDALRNSEPDRQVKWSIEENIYASGDKQLMRILLENLLGNAWKYTGKKSTAEIYFGQQQAENETIYYIRDNGVGFDLKYADKLFGVFQRLHGYNDFEGTGIGLATVKRIIRHHNGRIWAAASVDQGATFFFTLGTADSA